MYILYTIYHFDWCVTAPLRGGKLQI